MSSLLRVTVMSTEAVGVACVLAVGSGATETTGATLVAGVPSAEALGAGVESTGVGVGADCDRHATRKRKSSLCTSPYYARTLENDPRASGIAGMK
jgi:hypothetical protein